MNIVECFRQENVHVYAEDFDDDDDDDDDGGNVDRGDEKAGQKFGKW